MKYIIILITLLCLGYPGFAQQFDHGNNNDYTPFTDFAAPVAKPTPLDSPPSSGVISNLEKDIATKTVKGANSGIHFPKGTPGVKTVRYDLYVTDTIVNYTGKKQHAIAVNGSLPAPTLVFTIGDTALIYVHNNADEPTAVHWHGVQLPNRMDGVPYLTQQPIPPHTTHIYKFPVVQAGTNGDMKPMGMNMTLQEMDMNQVMYPEMGNDNESGMKNMDHMKGVDRIQDKGYMRKMNDMSSMDHTMHDKGTAMSKTTYVYEIL